MADRQIFNQFINASNVQQVFEAYDLFGDIESFEQLQNRFYQCNKQLWDCIIEKKSSVQYSSKPLQGKSILIVGAGPAGLITAIEAKLMGCSPTVVEKRTSFTRNNVILLWEYAVDYLKSLGAKYIYRRFCVGGLHHIGIRRLQCLLLKLCLLLGIDVQCGIGFDSMEFNDTERKWMALINTKESKRNILCDKNNYPLYFNSLVGADGLNSVVANFANFNRKTMKAKQAIGMTFNFVNSRTREEALLPEFGYSRFLKQQWFKELRQKSNVNLENCAYYRDETHYFVCTIPKDDLLGTGAVFKDYHDTNSLLARENIDRKSLENVARQIASHCNLPEHIQFKLNHNGQKDIELFDFTKKLAATEQVKIIQNSDLSSPLFVFLTGDALLEPFWPQGTGANRAILSSLDGLYFFTRFISEPNNINEIILESTNVLTKLHASKPSSIVHTLKKTNLDKIGIKTYSNCTYDPSTRYVR